jgi:hypothetical protein
MHGSVGGYPEVIHPDVLSPSSAMFLDCSARKLPNRWTIGE